MLVLSRSILFGFVVLFALASCGGGGGGGDGGDGGDGGGTTANVIASFELVDPSAAGQDRFGTEIVILSNGNIVVSDPNDSSVVAGGGAVHLYNPLTQTLISSVYGDQPNDQIGSSGITALPNGNFVIASEKVDDGAVADVGAVMLINGLTGTQIGNTIMGDRAFDTLGSSGITALSNNDYVIASNRDANGNIIQAGSVILVGTNGAPINTIRGDRTEDQLGSSVTPLSNGNFVIRSSLDANGTIDRAGSVILVGADGIPINTIRGNGANDQLGSGGITVLSNNNFVIASPIDDDNVFNIVDAGSVMLIGVDGLPLRTLLGDQNNDRLGSNGIFALPNDNFVIVSPFDDDGAIFEAGSVILVQGSSGTTIGPGLRGDSAGDSLGNNDLFIPVVALSNSNFVLGSALDSNGGIAIAGTVRLVSGSTGLQLAPTIAGDQPFDRLSSDGITVLPNDNFVITSRLDNNGGTLANAGSVMLVGADGIPISTTRGDQANDFLGQGGLPGSFVSGITTLSNNNFVIASIFDNNGIVEDAGSVMLINGISGAPVGSPIRGDQAFDNLGGNGITALTNDNFVIISTFDDNGAIPNAGSVRLMNGISGIQISAIEGNQPDDFLGFTGVSALSDASFVVVSERDNGVLGSVMHLSGINGAPIGSTISGTATDDLVQANVTASPNGDYFVLGLPLVDNNGLVDSGFAGLVAYPDPTTLTYAIGDTGPAGGIVFQASGGGLHGLEAAPADLPVSPWYAGCAIPLTSGAIGTAIGTGEQNTADILAACATSNSAADRTHRFGLNGYTDWFLPSRDELKELYLQKDVVGGFAGVGYWSSSELDGGNAWVRNFGSGVENVNIKIGSNGVRAVRAF